MGDQILEVILSKVMKCSLEFKGWIFMRLMSPFIFMDKRNFFEWTVLLQFIPAAFIPAAFALQLQRHTIMHKVQCTHLFICVQPILFHPLMGCSKCRIIHSFIIEGLDWGRHKGEAFLHQTTKTYKTQLQFFVSLAYAHNTVSSHLRSTYGDII